MSGGSGGGAVIRSAAGSTSHSTLTLRRVELHFQMSPGPGSSSKPRGIEKLKAYLRDGSGKLQSGPVETKEDGKIVMFVRGSAQLELTHGGREVARYIIRVKDTAIEAKTARDGVQRRLRMLGYQIGSAGAENNGIDPATPLTKEYDRGILEYQADKGVDFDGLDNQSAVQDSLETDAGG